MRQNPSKLMHVGTMSPLLAAAGFNTAPCCLSLHLDSSLYSITQIIREARVLTYNGRQVSALTKAISFYLGFQMGLCCLIISSYCFLMPPIFTGYMIMLMLWVISPILSFSLLFTPHDSGIMTHQPVKSTDLMKDAKRFFVYFLIRFCLVTSPVCILLYLRCTE
jgi:magnesium-transporting ATPase (P-type)